MKIEIALLQMGCTSLLMDSDPVTPIIGADSPVMAELIQEDKGLGSVSVSFPYLIFDETATRLRPENRRQKIIRLDRTEDGKVVFTTEDYQGRFFWRFVSTIQAE
jgi:hypothetical protein